MAHAQKPDSVFQRNGRVQLYRRGCQFSRVLAFLECGSEENDCSNTGWTVRSQTEDCWLPSPFASFPFTSPPVRHRVPSDSVSTLLQVSFNARSEENVIRHISQYICSRKAIKYTARNSRRLYSNQQPFCRMSP